MYMLMQMFLSVNYKNDYQSLCCDIHDNCNEKNYVDIIEGIRNGNNESLMLLYDLFGNLINRLVWILLGADSEHDDIVQQVFVNIIESIGSIRNPEALKSWIESVTTHTVRRELRRRKYRRFFHIFNDYSEEHSCYEIEKELSIQRFYKILDKMDNYERIIFTLYYVEDKTLEQMCAILNCSLATVKRKIANSKKNFLQYAKKDDVLASFFEEA